MLALTTVLVSMIGSVGAVNALHERPPRETWTFSLVLVGATAAIIAAFALAFALGA